MSVPFKFLALAGAALAWIGASAGAQTQRNKLFRRASTPRQASLDLGTGTYTRGPAVNNRGGTTVTDLTNIDIFDGSGLGWTAVDTGGGACTWFQMASKGNTAANQGVGVNPKQHGAPAGSDLMSNILFFYCSGALDVASGGVGGNVELGFYEGYTAFGGAPTTTAAIVNLTGMPGNTSPGGFFAGARCYGLNVLFSPLVAFADNLFVGYSWHYQDVGTDGLFGATFPFISCVVSCSGVSIFNGSAGGGPFSDNHTGLGEDGQGMLDAFDAFCTGAFPNGPTANTYTFATGGPFAPPFAPTTRASMGMEVHEASELPATIVSYNDTLPIDNLDTLTAPPPALGTVWTVVFCRAPPPPLPPGVSGPGCPSGRFQIRIWRDRLGGNGVPPNIGSVPWPAGTGGRKLASGIYFASIPPGQVLSGSPVAPTIAFAACCGSVGVGIPLDFVFCGLHFACQARSGLGVAGTGTPRLSSAIEGTIGTF